MRSTIVPVLLAAVIAGGCDRQSPPDPQGNLAAAQTADEVPPPSPDEAAGAAPAAAAIKTFDRSRKGEAAPTFGFQDPDGKPTTLAVFRGKPTLVNLWATWCAPCVKELPTLDALAARDGARINVVAISQDLDKAKLDGFWAKGGYRALRSSHDPALAFSTGLGATLPTTILYDTRGREVWRYTGDLDWSGDAAAKAIAEGA